METTTGDPFTTEWLEVDLDARRFHLHCRYQPDKGEAEGLCICGDGETVTAWDPYRPSTYRLDSQSPELCDAIQHQLCIVLDPEFRRDAYTVSPGIGVEGAALVFEGSFVMQFADDPGVMMATWSEAEGGARQNGKTYRTVPIADVHLVSPPAGSVLRNPGWTSPETDQVNENAPVPQLPSRMVTVGGEAMHREALFGRPTFLEFWATWCGPCRERVHHLQQLQEEYGDRVNVLAVNRDTSARIAEAFTRARGFRFPVTWDGGRRGSGLFADWRVDGVPTVFVLDREQRPLLRGHGMGWTDIRKPFTGC